MNDAHRFDRWATALFGLATLALLLAWPGWHRSDEEAANVTAIVSETFVERAEAFAAAHAIGEREGMPLVRPEPGAEVPVIARRFQFWPALELTAGQTYRLRLAAVDTVHSVAIAGQEVLLIPGHAHLLEITPAAAGPLPIQCAEYCGLGHNRMGGDIRVVAR